MLANLYPTIPPNMQAASEKAGLFLNGGKQSEEDDEPMRLFSFSKDANFIFSAFRQTHGIDLETANLHWWSFLALFNDLRADNFFGTLVSLRYKIKTGKSSKEERAAARELGDLFNIPEPDTRTPDEKAQEAAFLALLPKGA